MKSRLRYLIGIVVLVSIGGVTSSCGSKTPTNSREFEPIDVVWQQIIQLENETVNSLSVSPDGEIFAGTTRRIFRLSFDGQNWTMADSGLTGESILSIDFDSRDHIFAGSYNHLYRSADNGENWKSVLSSHIRSILSTNGDLFAMGFGDVSHSADNGDSWSLLNVLANGVNYFYLLSDITGKSNGEVYLGTDLYGVYQSRNKGQTWGEYNNGLDSNLILASDNRIEILATNSADDIFRIGRKMFRMRNGDSSWEELTLPIEGNWRGDFVFNSAGHIFYGTGEGVFRSIDNGDSWVEMSEGLNNTVVKSLVIDSDGYIYAGTYGNGIFRSKEPTLSN